MGFHAGVDSALLDARNDMRASVRSQSKIRLTPR